MEENLFVESRDSDSEGNNSGDSVIENVPKLSKQSKPIKKRSPAWQGFDEVLVTNNGVQMRYAQCKHCDKKYKLSQQSNASTGNMNKHLKICHADQFVAISFDQASDGTFIFSQENYRKALIKWIVVSSQPFTESEQNEFVELIRTLNPNAKPISDKTVRSDIMAIYAVKVAELKSRLSQVQAKISITIDGWTSKNVLPFVAIRAHWIRDDWKYETQLLDFVYNEGDHSGKQICKSFLDCLSQFGIPLSKILAITMDNATPNDTFITFLQTFGLKVGVYISAAGNQVRCINHINNLAVSDILNSLNVGTNNYNNAVTEVDDNIDEEEEIEDFPEDADEPEDTDEEDNTDENYDNEHEQTQPATSNLSHPITAKIRKLVRKIRKSSKLRHKLRQLCAAYKLKPLVPIIDVSIRWNATYNMIKRAIYLKVALNNLCLSNKRLIAYLMTDNEWSKINEINVILEKFDRATQLFSMERHSTISSYLPGINWLIDVLQEFSDENYGSLSAAADLGIAKLRKYKPDITTSKIPFIATFLNPALKLNYFKEHYYSKPTIKDIKTIICDYFETNYNVQSVNDNDNHELNEDEFFRHMHKRSRVQKCSTELQKYISSPLSNSKVDVLDFWKNQDKEYPCLSKMAMDFLPVQSSSTPVERDFSAGAHTVTPTRCSLKKDTIQASMCLKMWFRQKIN